MKIKKFYEPILKVDLIVLADCGHKEVEEYLLKNKYPSIGYESLQGSLTSLERKKKDGSIEVRYLMWIMDTNNFYTLVHECLHLVKAVFRDRFIPFTSKNDEIIAYYQEYFVKKIWRALAPKS